MKIAVLSGAGISAESGVPTFRGSDGLWNGRRPEEVATPEAFCRNPEDVWAWYYGRRRNLLAAEPNAGHRAIAAWQEVHDVVVATQNVDGLHQTAGSRIVHELHGSIWTSLCTVCGDRAEDRVTDFPGGELPRCPCGGLLRPGVIWFGEFLPVAELSAAEKAVDRADLVVIVGTSNLVYPAASLPLRAVACGVPVVEVNPEETPLSRRVNLSLRGTACELLPDLLARVSTEWHGCFERREKIHDSAKKY